METTITTGTGALTLAGAVAGFRAFSGKMTSPSDTCFYMIEAVDANGIPTGDWETGIGTYTGASTLTRTTVSRSSNADAIVTLAAGTKRVAIADIAATCFTLTGPAVLPIAGQVNLASKVQGNATFASMRAAQGVERIIQPHIGRTRFSARMAAANLNGWCNIGVNSATTIGSTFATFAQNTNMLTRAHRLRFFSAATAASIGGYYNNTQIVAISNGTGGGGFTFHMAFGVTDGATVTGARMLCGLTVSAAAPTNVNPASLTNVIGLAQVDGSTNLNIVFGGSTAQTPIDLGVNFPANTLGVDLYNFMLFCDPFDATKIGYCVSRYTSSATPAFETTGTIANTTPGTTLPASSSFMTDTAWRTNNATALAVQVDVDRAVFILD